MNNDELVINLKTFKAKLQNDVNTALSSDFAMGFERWKSWVRLVHYFFEIHLPNYIKDFKQKTERSWPVLRNTTRAKILEDYFIYPTKAFINSLILDGQNNELIILKSEDKAEQEGVQNLMRKAFIVHGHDSAKKFETARFLEKLAFEAVILHEQANGGKTIIEKLEEFTDVGFGIVLYTPDDVGEVIANQTKLRSRARQNVVFEHGLLIGRLGRERVFPLITDHSIELPGDISGMVYMSDNGWEIQLAKEIKNLGYGIDFNKLF